MRKLRFACLALLMISALPAAKERNWKDGAVIESGSERRSEVIGASTGGPGDVSGLGTTTTLQRRRWDEDTYVIDAGDRVIVISESIRRMGGDTISFRVRKPAYLLPGSQIKYAVEKDQFFVQGDDGKEHKFRIVRVSMKPPVARP